MIFDSTVPDLDIDGIYPRQDLSNILFADAREQLPETSPTPKGHVFTIFASVDSDHTGYEITPRSRTGYIIFLNNSPIYWFSKKHGGIDTSSIRSEFIAMKQYCEYIRGIQFKLMILGIPVSSYVYGDN
mmetsp:Transcript_19829/g.19060  ORF Transcript_19829/g.19060 Transcript_19829/m.19060 type:complete len:129 (-) Transcript_19829:185-571(-)